MTKSLDERARTITKLIHIAAHSRRFCNFATMCQIGYALMHVEVARLRKTWELVSPADMRVYRELEAMLVPVRNWHFLRTEINKTTGESGCIPFIGMYLLWSEGSLS